MCGRLVQGPSSVYVKRFALDDVEPFDARFNLAPTEPLAVIRERDGRRQLRDLYWGLVPAWAKDVAIGTRMINARAESIFEKNAFRRAVRRRRCLIPVEGFYEWKRVGRHKQPYLFRQEDGRPFALAGIWERWRGGPEPLESVSIVTTAANDRIAEIHDRMPVWLPDEDWPLWLDPTVEASEPLQHLLASRPWPGMTSHPVARVVNDARHKEADCVVPIELEEPKPDDASPRPKQSSLFD